MDPRDLAPDEVLLDHIFPGQPHISTSVILQDWDKCVFKASFPDSSKSRCPCIVRLETVRGDKEATQFAIVSAMQHIASLAIDNIVPNTFQTGVVSNAQGKRLQFSVMEFIQGDTLEEVWEQMSSENQRSVVTALVRALGKLHSIRISDARVQTLLRQVVDDSNRDSFHEAVMGGPSTGFLKDGPDLLGAITKRLKLEKPFCTILPTTPAGGVVVQSKYEDLGSVRLEKSHMEQWGHESVFCHNDLTPRNIILKPCGSIDGHSDYQLSAIIDWELAGFYPASYELSLQDTYLSGGNRLISFYSLLKRQMKDLVPASSPQVSLLQAMEILFESRQRKLVEGSNIPAIIRQRFMQILRLRRDENPYIGWVPQDQGEEQPVLSRADAQRLEDDVVAEIGEVQGPRDGSLGVAVEGEPSKRWYMQARLKLQSKQFSLGFTKVPGQDCYAYGISDEPVVESLDRPNRKKTTAGRVPNATSEPELGNGGSLKIAIGNQKPYYENLEPGKSEDTPLSYDDQNILAPQHQEQQANPEEQPDNHQEGRADI